MEAFLAIQLKAPQKYAEFLPADTLPGLQILDTFGRHSEGYQSYSFLFEEAGQRLVYSGDLHDADYLFSHLASLSPMPTTVLHDLSFQPENGGHAHYSQLQPYLGTFRIFGYHCDPGANPPDNPVPLVYHQPDLMYQILDGRC